MSLAGADLAVAEDRCLWTMFPGAPSSMGVNVVRCKLVCIGLVVTAQAGEQHLNHQPDLRALPVPHRLRVAPGSISLLAA